MTIEQVCDDLCCLIVRLDPNWALSGMAVETTEMKYNGQGLVTVRYRRVGDRWFMETGSTKPGPRRDQAIEVRDGAAFDYAMGHQLERALGRGPAWRDPVTLGGLEHKYLRGDWGKRVSGLTGEARVLAVLQSVVQVLEGDV